MPRASGRQRRSGALRGRWRRAGRRRQPGAGGRGVALRGRAEPRAPWPAAEEAARRRPALLGQRPPHSAPRAASQRRGTDTSMRLPARPAKFEVYPFPPSPAAASRRQQVGDSAAAARAAAHGHSARRRAGTKPPAGGTAPSPRPSPATFWVLLWHPWQRA